MQSTTRHIAIIVLLAIILHLPIFIGWIKPVPPNFAFWPPWNPDIESVSVEAIYFDYLQEYLPWQKLLHDSVAEGELPLWNRYQFCGTPFLANHLLSPFYPPIAAGLLVPYWMSAYLISLFNFLIGPIFMYLYLRRIKLDGRPALLGALVFCSSGLFNPFYLPWAAAIIWLPVALFIIEGWMQDLRPWRDVPWLALVFAFWSIGGYPVFVVYGIYFLLFYIVFLTPSGRKLTTVSKFFAALILGGIISAIQNLPTLFFYIESSRYVPEPYGQLKIAGGTPAILSGFLLNLLPSQIGIFKTGESFLGLVPFLFAPFAVVKTNARTKFYFIALGVCILISLIPPLSHFLKSILPLWRITPHPPVLPIYLSAAVLAAFGLQQIIKADNSQRRKLTTVFITASLFFAVVFIIRSVIGLNKIVIFYGVCCVTLLCLISIPLLRHRQTVWKDLAVKGVIITTIAIIAVPWLLNLRQNRPADDLFDTYFYKEHIQSLSSSNLRVYRMGMQKNLPPNMCIFWDIEDAGGYDSLLFQRYFDAAKRHGIEFHRGRKTLALDPENSPSFGFYEEFGIGIMLVSSYDHGPSGEGWVVLVNRPNSVRLFVNKDIRRAGIIPEGKYMNDAVPLDYRVDSANSIRVIIGGDKDAGDVIVRDMYASGWKAWVDGKPAKIEPYRDWMRSVEVAADANEVIMKYEPVEFKIGALLSVIGLFIFLAWLAGGYRRLRMPGKSGNARGCV